MKPSSPGKVIRVFHRWSGLALIIFLGLKILSGNAIAGRLGVMESGAAYRIHYSIWVDASLLFLILFHAAYGILKIWMVRGIEHKVRAFYTANAAALILFLISLFFIYII